MLWQAVDIHFSLLFYRLIIVLIKSEKKFQLFICGIDGGLQFNSGAGYFAQTPESD